MALLLERGTTKTTSTAELARTAGVSIRTFHRYLGTKENSVRPVLYAAIDAMAAALDARPADEALDASLAAAFSTAASGEWLERTLRLIPLLTETRKMRAVWAQSLSDGEVALTDPIARRMGLPNGSPRAAVLATVIMALIRRALTDAVIDGADPGPIFADYLTTLDAGPLARRVPLTT
ncbi:hypothetical protein HQQ80_06465 [Microbacteriaceae bacterium VKM Ac-2855]|nr:hypothetical protein [Microbacteriaceae bacterium VKM Ac-2855]